MLRNLVVLVSLLVLVTTGCHSEETEKSDVSSSVANNYATHSGGNGVPDEARKNGIEVIGLTSHSLVQTGTYYEFRDAHLFNKLKEYEEKRRSGIGPHSSLLSIGVEESVSINEKLFIHSIFGSEGVYTMCSINSIRKLPKDGIVLGCVGFTSDAIKYIEQDSGRSRADSFDIELTVKDGVMLYKGKKFLRIEEYGYRNTARKVPGSNVQIQYFPDTGASERRG